MEQTFSTGQVADLTRADSRTVRKWIDSGKLARVPGHVTRRVARSELVRFMEEHEFPLGPLADDGDPVEMQATIREAVESTGVPLRFVLNDGKTVDVRGRVEINVWLSWVSVFQVDDWHGGTIRTLLESIPLEAVAEVQSLPE